MKKTRLGTQNCQNCRSAAFFEPFFCRTTHLPFGQFCLFLQIQKRFFIICTFLRVNLRHSLDLSKNLDLVHFDGQGLPKPRTLAKGLLNVFWIKDLIIVFLNKWLIEFFTCEKVLATLHFHYKKSDLNRLQHPVE